MIRAVWYVQFDGEATERLDRLRGELGRSTFLLGLINDALEEAGERAASHYRAPSTGLRRGRPRGAKSRK